MRAAGQPFWLPRGDFVLLLSLAIVLIGVFVLPVLGAGTALARYSPRLGVSPARWLPLRARGITMTCCWARVPESIPGQTQAPTVRRRWAPVSNWPRNRRPDSSISRDRGLLACRRSHFVIRSASRGTESWSSRQRCCRFDRTATSFSRPPGRRIAPAMQQSRESGNWPRATGRAERRLRGKRQSRRKRCSSIIATLRDALVSLALRMVSRRVAPIGDVGARYDAPASMRAGPHDSLGSSNGLTHTTRVRHCVLSRADIAAKLG
jgi:hypothetical protein